MRVPPLVRFEKGLHPWVRFLIMPIFALCGVNVNHEVEEFAVNGMD